MALAAGIHRFTTGSWDGVEDVLLEAGADGYLSGVVEGAVIGGLSSNVCFVAGTVILTNVGKIAIETIEEGMLVWAKNTETGEEGFKEVLKTFENETDELVHLFVGGEEIITTPEHPFYVKDKGFIGAIHLRAGDIRIAEGSRSPYAPIG